MEMILSGAYSLVESVNDRPVYKVCLISRIEICNHRILSFLFFQRNEKTPRGREVVIWYNSDCESWGFTTGDSFKAKDGLFWMTLESEGKK